MFPNHHYSLYGWSKGEHCQREGAERGGKNEGRRKAKDKLLSLCGKEQTEVALAQDVKYVCILKKKKP